MVVMESVVFEDSPLGNYFEGEGGQESAQKTPAKGDGDSSRASSPSPSFAPRGRPTLPPKFRKKLPPALHISIPRNNTVAAIHNTYSKVVNSRLGRADNARFLERFRYIIVASQLLNAHSLLGQGNFPSREITLPAPDLPQHGTLTLSGTAATAATAFALAWMVHWVRGGKQGTGLGRIAILLSVVGVLAAISNAYVRRQWLQYLRQQTLSELSHFVSVSQEFDTAASAALTLVQEVELVSRGYRISAPLPPISRLEDRSQSRRCTRLRKSLRSALSDVIPSYIQASSILKPLSEDLDLEKYYDIYDISDTDYQEAMLGISDDEFDDSESLRVLKIMAARFHTIRKIFLCCLMALDAHGGKPDFSRWRTAVDEINKVSLITEEAERRLSQILREEESFAVPATPKMPLTPGRERWRAQLRKLNSLSAGIRGLQAKLHVLREESDKNLNETDDVSEMGANLMIQYESIGIDLKALMQEWEDGKAALASNIDRNERRQSAMSVMLSPTISLGGLTAVEEGGALDALRTLNGEAKSRSSMDFSISSSDAEEIFEAVAIPKQRSLLSREERIIRMKEDRRKRESLNERRDANTRMLRELESVINLRPRGRTAATGRVTSL